MAKGDSEAQARILIDKALEPSGWNLLDPKSVRLEVSGDGRRSDYVLSSLRGPLCVLEAKRDGLDPYDAKEQARGCAENLNAPFVILSKGREHWFWNYRRHDQDAYRIERLPSPTDLERLRLKNLQPPRPLLSEVISPDWLRAFRPDLKLRRYQLLAIAVVSRLFDERQLRKFLLEMATGTGKTLLCAALIRCFLLTRLSIDHGKAEENKSIFDQLHGSKDEIEGRFGGTLTWQRLATKRAGKIKHVVERGGYRGPEAHWPEIQVELD